MVDTNDGAGHLLEGGAGGCIVGGGAGETVSRGALAESILHAQLAGGPVSADDTSAVLGGVVKATHQVDLAHGHIKADSA